MSSSPATSASPSGSSRTRKRFASSTRPSMSICSSRRRRARCPTARSRSFGPGRRSPSNTWRWPSPAWPSSCHATPRCDSSRSRTCRPNSTCCPPDRVTWYPWTPDVEVTRLQDADVGIMPLVDNENGHAKSAFKMLQYMGCAIPSVVTPIGLNRDLLDTGNVGIGASDTAGWVTRSNSYTTTATRRLRWAQRAGGSPSSGSPGRSSRKTSPGSSERSSGDEVTVAVARRLRCDSSTCTTTPRSAASRHSNSRSSATSTAPATNRSCSAQDTPIPRPPSSSGSWSLRRTCGCCKPIPGADTRLPAPLDSASPASCARGASTSRTSRPERPWPPAGSHWQPRSPRFLRSCGPNTSLQGRTSTAGRRSRCAPSTAMTDRIVVDSKGDRRQQIELVGRRPHRWLLRTAASTPHGSTRTTAPRRPRSNSASTRRFRS